MNIRIISASIALCCLMASPAQAQSKSRQRSQAMPKVNSVTVEYRQSFNGKKSDNTTTLVCSGKGSVATINATEKIYVDYDSMLYFSSATLPDGQVLTTRTAFEYDKNLTVIGTEKILTWECTKYRTTINSNTIEIWATTSLGYSGTFQPQSGVPQGIVLKISRNGNNVIEADRIIRSPMPFDIFNSDFGKIVDQVEYRHAINNKDVITVPVFKNQYIGFNGSVGGQFDAQNRDTVYTVGGGTIILRRVSLPRDIEGRSIFARVTQQAVADAYDRTGSIFIIPDNQKQSFLDALSTDKGLSTLPQSSSDGHNGLITTENYTPPIELMRFFTPFGVGGYNHIKVKGQQWADSVVYRQNITYLAPILSGDVWVGAYIGNWVDKGHRLSMEIAYHPGADTLKDEVVIPLFNTVNLLEQAGQEYPVFFGKEPLKVRFYVDQTIKNPRLIYTSTGHGGWGGGDEFNPKVNAISLDEKPIIRYTPWRDDCGSYRAINPASGNFANGLSSSDLSRSAWCPGMVTTPVYIDLGKQLDAGWHTMEVSIPQGEPEGNSISYWCVSGAIVGQAQSE